MENPLEKQYCPYCMTPVVPGEPCPNCGLTGGSYTSQPHQLPAGTLLADRYLLGRVLGEGGFGITYIGCDTRLELRVAVKEYYPVNHVSRNCRVSNAVNCFTGIAGQGYEKGRERFIREARTMARMDKTPQIVAVRDYFQENNTAYIVMEYVDGTTFKELVAQKGGKISAVELLPMVEPLFGALEAMHALGLIHRDISPDNLMLENGMIRLLDFGCARESAAKGNETMTIVLKQGYSPVEQYQHKGQGPWTDVYSLAATMYYCLTGVTPPQALDRICDDELVPPRKLGADLTEAQELSLLFGMGLQPTRRFRSVREFYASLYQGVPVPVKPQVLYGPSYVQEEARPAPRPKIPAVEEKGEEFIPVTAPMEAEPKRIPATVPQVVTAPEAREQPVQKAPETAAPAADTPKAELLKEAKPAAEPPKKTEPKVEPPKEAESKVEPPKEAESKVEPPKKAESKVEPPKETKPEVDATKEAEPKAEPPKKAEPKVEPPKKAEPKVEPPKEAEPKVEPPKKAKSKAEATKKAKSKAEPPKETAPAENTPKTVEAGEEAPNNEPWHFPPVPDNPTPPAVVKKSKKKIWIPVAAACGLVVVLAVSLPFALGQGSPDPTVPGASTGSTASTVQTSPPVLNIRPLSGDCTQSFPEALADSTVDQIVLKAGSKVGYQTGTLVISKPVIIEEGANILFTTNAVTVAPGATLTVQGSLEVKDLTVQGNLEIVDSGDLTVRRRADVNSGQIHVKSWMGINGLLTVSGGGQVSIEDDGFMQTGCYLLESEDSIVAQEGSCNLDFDFPNAAIVNEDALFADAVHVTDYYAMKRAVDAGAKAIVIDGSVRIPDNFTQFRSKISLMISPEGEMSTASPYISFQADVLINRGTLAIPVNARCFINYGSADTAIYPAQLRGDERQFFMNLGKISVHGVTYSGPVFNMGELLFTKESDRNLNELSESFFCNSQFLNTQDARLEVDNGFTFELGGTLQNFGTIVVQEGGTFNNYGWIEEETNTASLSLSGNMQNGGYLGVTSTNFRIREGGLIYGSGIFYIKNPDGDALTRDNRITCPIRVEMSHHGDLSEREATTLEQLHAILDEGNAVNILIPEGTLIEVPEDLEVHTPIVVRGELRMAPGTTLSLFNVSVSVEGGRLEVDRVEAHDASQLVTTDASILFQPGGLLRIDEGSCGNLLHCDLDLNGASVEVEGENAVFLVDQARNCGDHLTVSGGANAYINRLDSFAQASQVLVESGSQLVVFERTHLSSGVTLTLSNADMHNEGAFGMEESASLVLEGRNTSLYSTMGDLMMNAGSSIEIRAGYLEMWAWGNQSKLINADIVNDGTLRIGITALGGHVVNRGEIQIIGSSTVTVYGTLENNGVIYTEDDSAALLTNEGTITGPEPVRRR